MVCMDQGLAWTRNECDCCTVRLERILLLLGSVAVTMMLVGSCLTVVCAAYDLQAASASRIYACTTLRDLRKLLHSFSQRAVQSFMHSLLGQLAMLKGAAARQGPDNAKAWSDIVHLFVMKMTTK
jgi:nicotinic acid phosphoribosyltransferase